jgi:gamma-glutamylcyclotransferase (GGCT)/AIG2-like uncharacterized protein YtfP
MFLFTYGTLRAAALDETTRPLLEGAKLVGEGTVRGTLGRIGPYLALRDGEDLVRGDVYEIHEGMLAALDDYEGSSYTRILRAVTMADRVVDAWTYVGITR